jgi:hypothetical protein
MIRHAIAETNTPPMLAGIDGAAVHEGDGMPAAAPRKIWRTAGWSNSWLAARVARRLVERHGVHRARRLALHQKAKHTTTVNGERHVTKPFLWLFWDLVAIDCGKVPQPVRFSLEAAS